ncbi:MAG: peptide deformylase [Patescibacteria group bacterium]
MSPEIVQVGHPALHAVAKDIPIKDIGSTKIQKVLADMKNALNSQTDGIGLAAPQIGVSLRIFMVSGKVLLSPDDRILATEGKKTNQPIPEDMVFINPVITKESKEKRWLDGEGCLSVRWLYGKVRRSTKVAVRAYDEKGNVFERGAGGLMAHIFQHEIDHLNGILFIDKAKDVQELEQDPDGHTHATDPSDKV